ncbi:MAG: hypothetical protein ACD_2C00141G0010 [uncultured bacterium (gcode 4)]|uniref:Uncharacterized protein n=1 Tax=uncultured bacterium (gcode 4) TaxID=1234023 RepID=K2G303_9BACT|nr:MAG: hypothetical protein ACD_2C00141G0010 [uncultured bacterium (gcode 4)]
MNQNQAVVQTIEKLWWIATLWQINHYIFEIKECEWKTKTPFASIRRIVQEYTKEIYKIKPWLYWLLKFKKINENKWFIIETDVNKNSKDIEEFNHYYYQGLLTEIWNLESYFTYVPAQDQNKMFLNKRLWDVVTTGKMFEFWYEEIIRRARTIDVIYFNKRKMPSYFYEVEHSTDIQNSLLKFNELQDFNSNFIIVADNVRRRDFDSKISQIAFDEIRNRVKFLDYEKLSQIHTKTFELHMAKTF